MPWQNRVTPAGDLIATPERGTFLGNRGVLHDDQGRIRRAWQVQRWLICLLDFKGRKRQVLSPGRYTELFFLDEATALAAGHRPCAECRHERFLAFRQAWLAGSPSGGATAAAIDARLHAERVGPGGTKRTAPADLDDLPDGVFLRLAGTADQAWLLWGGRLLAWSPGGYRERRPRPAGVRATLLTPPSTVAALRAGYVPLVHVTADFPGPETVAP
jgi:hypothetical protein